ncbi:hypothetical protein IE81DRAFT_107591 [Ceraceosorus guamensis]|uniref:Uncharacterized protein n=1 Tax=Ceraceosorus guamensis TaxID=1522189 RepID=A0A316W1G6_9BASI|nr:hypothetical protein IE81DRAFT_107591 [Ceraceosorus guamensis]PWN42968.1 hypothetical protein IE81DRAFT_107591 [Ceraceosorus guamensis]
MHPSITIWGQLNGLRILWRSKDVNDPAASAIAASCPDSKQTHLLLDTHTHRLKATNRSDTCQGLLLRDGAQIPEFQIRRAERMAGLRDRFTASLHSSFEAGYHTMMGATAHNLATHRENGVGCDLPVTNGIREWEMNAIVICRVIQRAGDLMKNVC